MIIAHAHTIIAHAYTIIAYAHAIIAHATILGLHKFIMFDVVYDCLDSTCIYDNKDECTAEVYALYY